MTYPNDRPRHAAPSNEYELTPLPLTPGGFLLTRKAARPATSQDRPLDAPPETAAARLSAERPATRRRSQLLRPRHLLYATMLLLLAIDVRDPALLAPSARHAVPVVGRGYGSALWAARGGRHDADGLYLFSHGHPLVSAALLPACSFCLVLVAALVLRLNWRTGLQVNER